MFTKVATEFLLSFHGRKIKTSYLQWNNRQVDFMAKRLKSPAFLKENEAVDSYDMLNILMGDKPSSSVPKYSPKHL